VVLDLRALQFLRADFPGRLLAFARRMTGNRKPLAVCVEPTVLEIFEISGMARQFPCFADLAAAVEKVRAV
jgi:hypothetical protein